MAKAEVDQEWVDTGKGRRQSLKSFHSTRHTCNSRLANAGVHSEIREAIVGHSDSETNKEYTHFEMDVLKRAISKIEEG